jgi:hypothetical protein
VSWLLAVFHLMPSSFPAIRRALILASAGMTEKLMAQKRTEKMMHPHFYILSIQFCLLKVYLLHKCNKYFLPISLLY